MNVLFVVRRHYSGPDFRKRSPPSSGEAQPPNLYKKIIYIQNGPIRVLSSLHYFLKHFRHL